MGITKNIQPEETILRMVREAFPQRQLDSYTELTEGMCNAAYLIRFSDGGRSVLKIASGSREGFLSNEVNLMAAEVRAMQIVRERNAVKVAEVQCYDTSRTLCSGDYFFMECLDGQSCISAIDSFTEQEKQELYNEIGQAERKITSIRGEQFGLLGAEERYDSLADFIYQLISNVLQDAKRKNIVIGVEAADILSRLAEDRGIFDEVKYPVLVHWDMWEGNIFVKDRHVCGIIDWERAMWGEAFMDDRFRRHTRNPDFLKGYGKEEFTAAEMQRICWYDVLLYLTMMTEGAYRGYEDDSQYQWVKPLFEASFQEIMAAEQTSDLRSKEDPGL